MQRSFEAGKPITLSAVKTIADMKGKVAATNTVSGLIGRAPVSRVASALNAKGRGARNS